MMLRKNKFVWILWVLAFAVTLYTGVYYSAKNSDAFAFVKEWILSSAAIASKTGDIKRVDLDYFGFFEQKTIGSTKWVSMFVRVTGELKTLELDVRARKAGGGDWVIERIENQGEELHVQ